MNEFLLQNDLTILDFKYKQGVSYTYHNAVSRSYIDHVAASEPAVKLSNECKIQALSYENLSDHLPIKTVMSINCSKTDGKPAIKSEKEYPPINWNNKQIVSSYKNNIVKAAAGLPDVTIDDIKNSNQSNKVVNEMCTTACDLVHGVCVQTINEKKQSYKGYFKAS